MRRLRHRCDCAHSRRCPDRGQRRHRTSHCSRAAMTTLERFNPFAAETLQCPYPHYARMRDEAPVLHLDKLNLYLVTRHDLVLSILRDPATFSSKFGRPTMPLSGDDARRLDAAMAEGYPRTP